MAALSPHYPLLTPTPTLKDYFTVTVFHDAHAHSGSLSRPSSSSSSSSYTSPASTTYTDSPAASSRSASWSSFPTLASPYQTTRPRPLPTPPTPSGSPRASLPPRPLPRPPVVQHEPETRPARRSIPLPTPPTVPEFPAVAASPPQSQQSQTATTPPSAASAAPAVTAVAGASVATPPPAPPRPAMTLSIPAGPQSGPSDASLLGSLAPNSPLSPIAFDFPGPRELRRRREEELGRCMKDLGFVEAPPAPAKATLARAASEPLQRPGRHTPAFSVSSTAESDEERDVVLLMDHHTDEETDADADAEPEEHPMRSESRAAMRTLFADVDSAPSPLAEHAPDALAVDVQVEIVSKKAAARTRRRYSRKWVREKSGKRWTEQDFSEILAQLRKLR